MSVAEHVFTATVHPPAPVVIPAYEIDHPEVTTYVEGFEKGLLSGWQSTAPVSIRRDGTARTGSLHLRTNATTGATQIALSRTFEGLTAGLVHVFSLHVRALDDSGQFRIVVPGVATGAWTVPAYSPDSQDWYRIALAFVPTGSSATIRIEAQPTAGSILVDRDWDDFSLVRSAYVEQVPEVTLPTTPFELDVTDASVTVDDSKFPYIQAQLTCPTPEATALEQLNPHAEGLRIRLHQEVTFHGPRSGTAENLNLILRARNIDKTAGTMTLDLTSDELRLVDYGHPRAEERVYGLAVRPAVELALSRIGATLEAGGADGNVVTDELPPVVTNLFTNPGVETNAASWATGSSATTTVARSTARSRSGVASLAATTNSTSAVTHLPANGASGVAASANTDYTASVYIRLSSGNGTAQVLIRSLDSAGTIISTTPGTAVAVNAVAWTRVSVSRRSDTNAARVAAYTTVSGLSNGVVAYHDDALLTTGDQVLPYFDGSTVDTGLTDYGWVSTAHASASTATPKPNTAAMIWKPGVTGWRYIEPLLSSTGLQLYADADGLWRLIERDALQPGQITVAPRTGVTAGNDRIDRDFDEWYDSVVIEYEGTVYDIATADSTPTRTLFVDWSDRPAPKFGAAQQMLDRAQGKGRQYEIETGSDYSAQPGQQVVITLPDNLPVLVGIIRSITWHHPSGLMDVRTRGLIETPETGWLFAPSRTWNTFLVGTDWTEYAA